MIRRSVQKKLCGKGDGNLRYIDAVVFMVGLAALIMSGLEVLKYVDQKSRRIPHGSPAGTYEVDMDEYF